MHGVNFFEEHIGAVPKLALNRIEAAQALGCSPATIDRLTIRGLLRPCRATYRPVYWVKELERFLKENSVADYVRPEPSTNGLPGHRTNRHGAVSRFQNNFPIAPPSAVGNQQKSAENKNEVIQ
jgi:hypothetical protein